MHKARSTVGSVLSVVFVVACLTFSFALPMADAQGGTVEPAGQKTTSTEAQATSSSPAVDETMRLKAQLASQEREIQELRAAVNEQKQLLERSLQLRQGSQPASTQTPSIGQVASTTAVIPVAAKTTTNAQPFFLPKVNASAPGSGQPQYNEPAEGQRSPLSFRIGDADFTPGGFMDFTALFRSTNVGSGIGTSFGSIPFSGTPAGSLTETRFTAQNSRLSLLATSKVNGFNVKGYVESDFLGFTPTNAFVTSNSMSLRLRLYWVEVTRSKFEFMGGQSWSMLNPNRTGLSPMPSDIFYSQNMDTNYQVGLTWSRQAQFRFIYHPTKEWAAGVSLENPQQYVSTATLPGGSCSATPPSPFCSQVDTGSNTATPNLHPDIIAKVAYDPMIGGLHEHVEVAGLLTSVSVMDPTTAVKSTATGGGGSVNFNLEVVKNFHAILNTFYSDGGGRYIFALGPQFIVRPDASGNLGPSLVQSGSGIAGFEYQVTKPTMLYGYYGGAYFKRNTAIDPATGKLIGFGYDGSPSSQNKSVQEGTFGIVQTFWKNPRYGALQLITQYSYLTRAPWFVKVGTPKNAHASMGYVDVRYVLP